ncbi:hypothetical protein FGG08_000857 [Glutinoglossum americanum]|uniref:Uncharacterized protein n=1 Tax=Glutinoglossum americanum TaxID=1670608 RepID=A0A9P8I362_9PEZI|nr:hypothetical protein FGG08_000857 [Glutinoglossum americanum]
MDGNPHFMDLHSHLSHRKNQTLPRAHTTPQTQASPPDTKKHRGHHTKSTVDKKIAQSAVSLHPPSSVFSGPSAGTSSAGSQSHSRRDSLVATGEDAGPDDAVGQRAVSAEEVASGARKARIRKEELRASIAALTKHSSNTTSILDDTYYLLLEKAAALSSAIAQLRDIASLTARLHQDFQSEAEALERDLKSRIDMFNSGFESEQKIIEGLEGRVRGQRVKAAKLGERLEEVRRRVKGWERTEGEWQAKTSRRLRILWGALSSIALLFLVVHYWPGYSPNSQPPPKHHDNVLVASDNIPTDSSLRLPQPSEDSSLRVAGQVHEHTTEAFPFHQQPKQHRGDPLDEITSSYLDAAERTLRLFDEL